MNDNDGDNIYYNFIYYNNTLVDQPAIINQVRTQNIVSDPTKYKMAIMRYSVPSVNIPMINKFPENYYYVKMNWDNASTQVYLTHIPNQNPDLGRIWSYQEFIDTVNNALKQCYNQLLVLKPLLPQTVPPFLYINVATEKIELYFQTSYDSSIANNTQVIFNNHLYYKMPSIKSYANALDESFTILVHNNILNLKTIGIINYYIVYQESKQLFLISDFSSLIFESDKMTTRSELLGIQSGTNNNKTFKIISDFKQNDATNDRSPIVFYPQGPLRFIDLTNNSELREMDLRVSWTTSSAEEPHLVYIPPGTTLSMKLLFRKINPDGTFNYT